MSCANAHRGTLMVLRHEESTANEASVLTRALDVDLSPPGVSEAQFDALRRRSPYANSPTAALTRTENLRDVIRRVTTFADDRMQLEIRSGRVTLIVCHVDSFRALFSTLDQLAEADVENLDTPTGQPLVYRFAPALSPTTQGCRNLDPETASAASVTLASQGGT